MAREIMIAGAALTIAAAAPADIDAQLVNTTGCGVGEIERLLNAGADRAALALMPLLDEPVELADLAAMIGDDRAAIGEIRTLYASLSPPDGGPVGETPNGEASA